MPGQHCPGPENRTLMHDNCQEGQWLGPIGAPALQGGNVQRSGLMEGTLRRQQPGAACALVPQEF